jgi:DNA-binding response OmpR family regulator
MRLLIVEDEPKLGQFLTRNLTREGFAVDLATTLEMAKDLSDTNLYDLIILDLRLPDGSGLDFLKARSLHRERPPVIILTAADSTKDRVEGLNAGADDYLGKPFAHEELIARIGALLRRPGNALGVLLKAGDIEFDTIARSVSVLGKPLTLPRREITTLELLMRATGRVVVKEALESAVYTIDDEPSSNAIEANVSRLRRRLKASGSKVEINVVRGLGYILIAAESGAHE